MLTLRCCSCAVAIRCAITAQIEQQIKQLNAGVKLVMMPENALLFANSAAYRQQAEKQGDGPLQNAVRELARRYGVWLLVGSMPLISRENPELITTSSLLFDEQGEIRARYDKLHMFDVDINDAHGHYRESDTYQHGQHLTVVDTPVGRLGMTICYDLRFPALFRALRAQGRTDFGAGGLYPGHRRGALGNSAARSGDREPVHDPAPAQVGRHGPTCRTRATRWPSTAGARCWLRTRTPWRR